MSDSQSLRDRFTANAEEFDALMTEMLQRDERLAAELDYLRGQVLYRTGHEPHDAIAWCKSGSGHLCHWIHVGPTRLQIANPGEVQLPPAPIVETTRAPDLLPDAHGPLCVPLVDAPDRHHTGTTQNGEAAAHHAAGGAWDFTRDDRGEGSHGAD